MRVLVCGGRNYANKELLFKQLDIHKDNITCIISGCAKGADTLAIEWAKSNNILCLEYPADWNKYGKKAGPIRNQQMIEEAFPNLVIAFPGGTGTNDMIKRARSNKIDVIQVKE